MEKICVVLTGGTICSLPDKNGKNQSNATITSTRLTDYYSQESNSPFRCDVEFDVKRLEPDILSENMTVGAWDDLLKIFQTQINFDDYKGIIVLHGTDTLAYTSSFLSMALAGIKIPVCMVSAQLRLGDYEKGEWVPNEKTNGYANFRASVELIMNGILPNVYVVYRNEENEQNGNHDPGEFLVHYGAHLLQCPNASNNFHSFDEMHIPDTTNARLEGKAFQTQNCLYQSVKGIKSEVLMLRPYTNLNYDVINLESVKTVIHGTYHSESVCIGRIKDECREDNKYIYSFEEIIEADQPYSILYLLKRCAEKEIPVFLAPCDKNSAAYGTTANALEKGALYIADITIEAAYAKAVLGCALGKQGSGLTDFLNKSINGEIKSKMG